MVVVVVVMEAESKYKLALLSKRVAHSRRSLPASRDAKTHIFIYSAAK